MLLNLYNRIGLADSPFQIRFVDLILTPLEFIE
jgi:hypothetical protein